MARKQVSVLGQFLATVKRHELVPVGSSVLAAVSGGADSVCLLDLLRLVRARLDLRLGAFHLNHGLRQTASRDEEFVRKLCLDWGIELAVEQADVAAFARRHRLGIEEAGRNLRYRHLERAARRLSCDVVALGHTANDNLETMLLNLVRGAGARGLAGIPVRRGRFVRPLIDTERGALEGHLRARGIAWVSDESNLDPHFRRNAVRLRVVPELARLNPEAVANARRAGRLLADEDEYLDGLARQALAVAARGPVQIDVAKFRNYNNILRRRMVRLLLPGLDAQAVETVLRFAERPAGGRLALTQGVRARRYKGIIEIEHGKTERDVDTWQE